ncbi:hypothetical protein ACIRN4_08125 [Pimelobacter simplex]|uniref:hypothetical protein n=1 Tax=Nocardioides simplex TaxID=2045 RepID=UPI000535B85D|nr:hypothetical protein [Pimelobacter simplex]MCG8152041.1 hypothetical protein [Pimelobacter simplex]GEB12791.1 hypothetical protein NSI01_11060 [Pimelobacter simplex]SFM54226.1 hypothetical protein SAMN05421671_2239 [Pimelobacter simplex]
MENITMFPAMTSAWQLTLSPSACPSCATSALPTFEVPGIAARAIAPNAAFAPFATLAAAVATGALKRERAHAGMGQRGTTAYVPGSLAWSPPI